MCFVFVFSKIKFCTTKQDRQQYLPDTTGEIFQKETLEIMQIQPALFR